MIKTDFSGCRPFVGPQTYDAALRRAHEAFEILEGGTGAGHDFLGWNYLPSQIGRKELNEYLSVVEAWVALEVEVVVVIGIGGSYLGAKAAIEALNHSFSDLIGSAGGPVVVFAGQNLSEEYLAELTDLLKVRSCATVVISKSGTTTEPAVAFRVVRDLLLRKYGREGARERIVAITDARKGALKTLADREGYRAFVIPDNIGGRYSVLTPVGLLPIALAGYDIDELVRGARDMQRLCAKNHDDNPAIQYAAMRNALYESGKNIELLASFHPRLRSFAEWWKQLFGESEGKQGKGIFPASVLYTTDLHSMGQYVQQGRRNLFETVIAVEKSRRELLIERDADDLDGLNYLAGQSVEHCNRMAAAGTRFAHVDGGVPNLQITIRQVDEYSLGQLFYFFEKACGISAYMLGVNPFDQPGVEDYKQNMFALLGKPGYEEQGAKLQTRLAEEE